MNFRNLMNVAPIALLVFAQSAAARDLAQEKEIVCAAFAHNASSIAEALELSGPLAPVKYKELKFKYMLQAKAKYLDKQGVSMDTMNSAQRRAQDSDQAEVEAFMADSEKSGRDAKQALSGFLDDRRKKLGCN